MATVLEVLEMQHRRRAEYLHESEGLIRRQFNSLRDSHTLVERELREKVVNLEQQRMESQARRAEAHAERWGAHVAGAVRGPAQLRGARPVR